MMERLAALLAREGAPRRLNAAPSPAIAYSTPWISIALSSMAVGLPLIAKAPLLPPLGYLALLGWRQLRPGLLPVWAGAALGFVDDLFSGQPMGSAILLWSACMLALDVIEARFPWRTFLIEWLVAAGMILAYLLATTLLANITGGATPLRLVLPQLLLSVLCFPVAGRVVAALDRWRLGGFRIFG
ncbi:MAG TPA: rod shape-determining protein MreD [Novosphingobium sp.]|nr:rod shape-determining protein MreD [Novosphingobium sp.]